MVDPFRSPKRRLARAREHIEALDSATKAFFTGQVFQVAVEQEFVGIQLMNVIKLKLPEGLPDEFSDLAVDAIDAIRSALDQACYASAAMLGNKDAKSAYFPFADTESQLENTIKGRCKDLRPEIIALVRAFAPYEDGNRLLWAFNKARQSNQHKILAGVGTKADGIWFEELGIIGSSISCIPFDWNARRSEVVVARFDLDGVITGMKLKADVHATFSDAGPLTREPAIATLREFARIAESIVLGIEAESLRLKGLLG